MASCPNRHHPRITAVYRYPSSKDNNIYLQSINADKNTTTATPNDHKNTYKYNNCNGCINDKYADCKSEDDDDDNTEHDNNGNDNEDGNCTDCSNVNNANDDNKYNINRYPQQEQRHYRSPNKDKRNVAALRSLLLVPHFRATGHKPERRVPPYLLSRKFIAAAMT